MISEEAGCVSAIGGSASAQTEGVVLKKNVWLLQCWTPEVPQGISGGGKGLPARSGRSRLLGKPRNARGIGGATGDDQCGQKDLRSRTDRSAGRLGTNRTGPTDARPDSESCTADSESLNGTSHSPSLSEMLSKFLFGIFNNLINVLQNLPQSTSGLL